MAEPTPRSGLSSDLHRRDPRQDPRRAGRQPAHLRRARGDLRGPPRHSRAVGRRRRRRRQVLAACTDRAEEPRRRRRAHGRLRGPLRPARTRSPPSGRPRSPRPASCTCCATASATPAVSTGTPSPRLSNRSTPRRPRPRRGSGSPSSPRTGAAEYPAIVRLWDNAWAEFVPFLAFDAEIRRVICSTNAIESVNARIRRAVKARGHFRRRAGRAQVRLHGDHEPGLDRHRPQTLGHALDRGNPTDVAPTNRALYAIALAVSWTASRAQLGCGL